MTSKITDKLKDKISKGRVNLTEVQRLGHFVDLGDLHVKKLRSSKLIKTTDTPQDKQITAENLDPHPKSLSRIIPEENRLFKRLSFEDISQDISFRYKRMADFSIADFNRVIPEFKGETAQLHVFLKRCDTFHNTLTQDGKQAFLSHIIFKLAGKAFLIYESKQYNDWPTLKADLLEGIRVSKSASAIQNELINLRQGPNHSAKEFADIIREKLKELSDIIGSLYQVPEVVKSFKVEHEKIAIRAFKEGLRTPLKHRIVNYDPKSLDELVKKAVEEEPYVAVLRSSLEDNSPRNNDSGTTVRTTQTDDGWSRVQNRNKNRYFKIYDQNIGMGNNRNWRQYREHNNENRPPTPFPRWENRSNNTNHNNSFANGKTQTNQNSNSFHNGNDNRRQNICIRCNRRGHTSDQCYARLPNAITNFTSNENDLVEKVKQVSFLEIPQATKQVLGPARTNRFQDRQK